MAAEQSEAFASVGSPGTLKKNCAAKTPFWALYLIEYLFQVFRCDFMQTIMHSDFIFYSFLLNFCF